MDVKPTVDVRYAIFRGIARKTFTACIISDEDGVLAGSGAAAEEAERLGIILESIAGEGTRVRAGEVLARLRGTPEQMARAEEVLIGLMAKPSGIATATREFVERAGKKPRIVCGAWKKMPPEIKDAVRGAVAAGGGSFRISPRPFVYLDKNYVEMLGGIRGCLEAVAEMNGCEKVVQLKGRHGDVAEEACEAASHGASIVFIDTGRKEDIARVSAALSGRGLRERVKIAFAGNIGIEDLKELKSMDVDILDIGRAIVDAPLLDMRMEVMTAESDARE